MLSKKSPLGNFFQNHLDFEEEVQRASRIQERGKSLDIRGSFIPKRSLFL